MLIVVYAYRTMFAELGLGELGVTELRLAELHLRLTLVELT